MYTSPLTERIRKRRAFADRDLDSTPNVGFLNATTMSSPPPPPTSHTLLLPPPSPHHPLSLSLSSPVNSSHPQPSSAVSSTGHTHPLLMRDNPFATYSNQLQSFKERQQLDFGRYFKTTIECSLPNIDVVLRQNTNVHSPPALADCGMMVTSDCCSTEGVQNLTKPKLSFSIESIIGIK